jgi:hypothetical protein
MFDDVVTEPVPEKFRRLLDELERTTATEGRRNSARIGWAHRRRKPRASS